MIHRRFGNSVVTVTFYGNGGMTAGSEDTVVMKVKKGTRWMDVVKPEFFIPPSIKQQNGYTFIQGDDSTGVDSSFVVLADMVVWASYTLVEIGVVTYAGEVMKTQEWIEKYGTQTSPDFNYYKNYNNYWFVRDFNNLILGCFFKSGDSAFILPACYEFGDSMFGFIRRNSGIFSTNSTIDNFGGSDIDMSVHGFDHIDCTKISGTSIFPYLWNPPQFTEPGVPQSIINGLRLRDIDAKAYWSKLYELTRNHTDANGISGSPLLEYVRTWEIPSFASPGDFYIPSWRECSIIFDNEERMFRSVGDLLTNWQLNFPSGSWNNSSSHRHRWQYVPAARYYSQGFFFPWRSGGGTYANLHADCALPIKYGEISLPGMTQTDGPFYARHVYLNVLTGEPWIGTNGIEYNIPPASYDWMNFWHFVCDVSHLFS